MPPLYPEPHFQTRSRETWIKAIIPLITCNSMIRLQFYFNVHMQEKPWTSSTHTKPESSRKRSVRMLFKLLTSPYNNNNNNNNNSTILVITVAPMSRVNIKMLTSGNMELVVAAKTTIIWRNQLFVNSWLRDTQLTYHNGVTLFSFSLILSTAVHSPLSELVNVVFLLTFGEGLGLESHSEQLL